MAKIHNKSLLLLFFLLGVLSPSGWSEANKYISVYAIVSSDREIYNDIIDVFKARLESKNIGYNFSKHILDKENVKDILAEIEAQEPDMVLAISTEALEFANTHISHIPVVFCMAFPRLITHPLRSNITGVEIRVPEEVRLQMVKEILPRVHLFNVFYSDNSIDQYNELVQASKKLRVKLIGQKIYSEKELPGIIKKRGSDINCLLILLDNKLYYLQSIRFLLLESLRKKFMVVGISPFFTKAGAIMSVHAQYSRMGDQVGDIAARIAQKDDPSQIPIQKPEQIEYSLNISVAERLGIDLNPEAINHAHEVYGE